MISLQRKLFYRLYRLVHLLYYSCRYLVERNRGYVGDNPVSEDRFDIVVPVCLRDVGLLRLQARSIGKFLDPSFDGRIYVILNDWRYYLLRRKIRKSLPAEYGQHSDKVIFCPFFCLSFRIRGYSGWTVQQICKLAISGYVTGAHYLALDAKNIFVKPFGRPDFVSQSGKALHTLAPWDPSYIPECFHASFSYFGLDPELSIVPQPITPFVLTTKIVRQLIEDVEKREHASLSAFFRRRRWIAEFVLYVAYLYHKSGSLEPFMENVSSRSVMIWESEAENRYCVEEQLRKANGKNVLAFGVHPRLLQKLSVNQLRALEEFWRALGIITANESIFDFCPDANSLATRTNSPFPNAASNPAAKVS
jgi:hypothetical protein